MSKKSRKKDERGTGRNSKDFNHLSRNQPMAEATPSESPQGREARSSPSKGFEARRMPGMIHSILAFLWRPKDWRVTTLILSIVLIASVLIWTGWPTESHSTVPSFVDGLSLSTNPPTLSATAPAPSLSAPSEVLGGANANIVQAQPPQSIIQAILSVFWPPKGWKGFVFAFGILFAVLAAVWNGLPNEIKLLLFNKLTSAEPNVVGYYPGVEIEENVTVVDMSEWTPVPPGTKSHVSGKVIWDTDLICRRIREDARFLAHRVATTGIKPGITSGTHSYTLKQVADNNIKRPSMNKFDFLLDITKEPLDEPFKAHIRSLRFGGNSDLKTEWACIVAMQPTRKLVLEVRFPSSKPGHNLRYSAFPRSAGVNTRFVTPDPGDINTSEVGMVRWTIQYPHLNYVYRIDWDW